MVLHILTWALLVAEALVALPIAYLALLAVSAILAARRQPASAAPLDTSVPLPRFAILVPAHDEEKIILTLLRSLTQLTYPRDRYTVHVVADNCADGTAAVANTIPGVQVHERANALQRGKGHALSWLVGELDHAGALYDAYVVLDADGIVNTGFLAALARELQQGAQAVQASNTVLNTTDSPSTAIRWIALTLMNHVRPLGRNGLGASSTLTGNGMCLRRDIVARYPFSGTALTEDYHYYLALVADGVRVRYAPGAVARSEMPVTFSQMRTQDVRWEATGPAQNKLAIAWRLLREGIRQRDGVRLEAIAELITPSLSFLVVATGLFLVAAALLRSAPALVLSALILLGLLCYVGSALYLLRPPRATYRALLYAPGFIAWKLWVVLVVLRRKSATRLWLKTSRAA